MNEVLEMFRGQDIFTSRNQDPFVRSHPISSARLSMMARRSAESPYVGVSVSGELIYWSDRIKTLQLPRLDRSPAAQAQVPDPRGSVQHEWGYVATGSP